MPQYAAHRPNGLAMSRAYFRAGLDRLVGHTGCGYFFLTLIQPSPPQAVQRLRSALPVPLHELHRAQSPGANILLKTPWHRLPLWRSGQRWLICSSLRDVLPQRVHCATGWDFVGSIRCSRKHNNVALQTFSQRALNVGVAISAKTVVSRILAVSRTAPGTSGSGISARKVSARCRAAVNRSSSCS